MLQNDRDKLDVVMPTDDWMEGNQVSDQSTSYSLISLLTKNSQEVVESQAHEDQDSTSI